jgi:hypothetical protein
MTRGTTAAIKTVAVGTKAAAMGHATPRPVGSGEREAVIVKITTVSRKRSAVANVTIRVMTNAVMSTTKSTTTGRTKTVTTMIGGLD